MLSLTVKKNMSHQLWEFLGTILGVLIGSMATYFATRRKNTADATEAITRAAGNIVANFEKRVAALECEVKEQDQVIKRYGKRLVTLMDGIRRLIAQLSDLGQLPVWTPDEWDPDGEEKDAPG